MALLDLLMKRRQKQRLPVQVEITNPNVEERIEELKKQLNEQYDNHYERIYSILKEIMELRQTQIKNYSHSSLAREKGIHLSRRQISYIFCYRFLSVYARRMIKDRKIKESTVLYIIRQDNKFRQPKYQDKAVKLYVEKKINTRHIQKLKNEKIFDGKKTEEIVSVANEQLLTLYQRLTEAKMLVKHKGHLFSNESLLKSTVVQLEGLAEDLKQVIKNFETPKEKNENS